jgi:hypothetical protein
MRAALMPMRRGGLLCVDDEQGRDPGNHVCAAGGHVHAAAEPDAPMAGTYTPPTRPYVPRQVRMRRGEYGTSYFADL